MNTKEKFVGRHLKFQKYIETSTLTSSFQTRFLMAPCQACGSYDHPLLSLTSDVINTDNIRYGYQCPNIKRVPLYPPNYSGLCILYILKSEEYARSCQYNLNTALNREIIRNEQKRTRQPAYIDSFLNDIRRICIQHEIYQKRLHDDTSEGNSESQESSMTGIKRQRLEDDMELDSSSPKLSKDKHIKLRSISNYSSSLSK